ncbi:MAG TPA: DUF2339 domain-containing protein, partial [Gemmatimonadales bacterium]|nr:DUF2339 domain-containing protein [Gemmatimonadales bacterium]
VSDEQKETIEALERRVATLENLVRRLTFTGTTVERPPLPAPPEHPVRRPSPPVVRAAIPTVRATAKPATDLEQWFGQRGLLAVGVLALLAAAAFFLKYAFDRGWVSPLFRALGAILAGIAVGAWGQERILRGMRTYGAALIGAGGGLVYLGLWAAAGPFELFDRQLGILLLAATTVAVTMIALHHEIEWLAIWALGGAYLAPIILATAPNPQGFLAYLEVIGLGTGILAYTMAWRATFNLALFGYLLLAMGGASPALGTASGAWLIAAGGVLALHVTQRRVWPEARLGVLLLTWAAFGVGAVNFAGPTVARWIALGGLLFVFGVIWVQQLLKDPFELDPASDSAPLERFLFIANPIALLVLAYALEIPALERSSEAFPAALALLYLAAGWQRRTASHLIMGFAMAALATAAAWDSWVVAISWTVLALVALASEREAGRPGGRQAATGLATMAGLCLFTAALFYRGDGAAFTDTWALGLYVLIAGTAAAARWWGTETRRALWKRGDAEWMWILCGAAVFLGGSIEFNRHFGAIALLAGDLALSVWWLLYAGALVFVGFQVDRKQVRSAGLTVAALAGLKIVFYDLSNLNALYRVGSFFALAIIALAVAYAYNRRARASAA